MQRDLGHAGGLALARAGKDHVGHVRAAQALGALLAQHPADGVGDVRFAATVRTNDGRNAVTGELEFGAVAKRFEAQNLELFEFQQGVLLACSRSPVDPPSRSSPATRIGSALLAKSNYTASNCNEKTDTNPI